LLELSPKKGVGFLGIYTYTVGHMGIHVYMGILGYTYTYIFGYKSMQPVIECCCNSCMHKEIRRWELGRKKDLAIRPGPVNL
jgi:hypothetical protein